MFPIDCQAWHKVDLQDLSKHTENSELFSTPKIAEEIARETNMPKILKNLITLKQDYGPVTGRRRGEMMRTCWPSFCHKNFIRNRIIIAISSGGKFWKHPYLWTCRVKGLFTLYLISLFC
jgi:hypothetical protein